MTSLLLFQTNGVSVLFASPSVYEEEGMWRGERGRKGGERGRKGGERGRKGGERGRKGGERISNNSKPIPQVTSFDLYIHAVTIAASVEHARGSKGVN